MDNLELCISHRTKLFTDGFSLDADTATELLAQAVETGMIAEYDVLETLKNF